MDIVQKIIECQTVDELTALENLYALNKYEQGLVCERRIEIIVSVRQGLMANLMDSWTPEQIQEFLDVWNDNECLWQTCENIEGNQDEHA